MESIYKKLIDKECYLSLIGLGYVGLPIAIEFSKHIKVIGFDKNERKINLYKNGIDPTNEVGNSEIIQCNVDFTCCEEDLQKALFHIVAVPTPIKEDYTPNLDPVKSASEILGRNLQQGSIVVYESTVYPGVTEEVCIPILEKTSGLKCGIDFKIGYSPERINPGDKVHRLTTITKIVSGMDEETLSEIASTYELVVEAGVFKAENIKTAEAAKVIENSQRDINIAFMNELSVIFEKMGIDTKEVLNAAGTKWNFLKFYPGLVGGHCIGVDPYYLAYKAEQLGYHPEVIMSGRRINDSMGKHIAEVTVKKLILAGISIKTAKVCILGFTFKENCPDTRNSKVYDILKELSEYSVTAFVADHIADKAEAKQLYNINIYDVTEINNCDAIIVAVAHDEFLSYKYEKICSFYKNTPKKKVMIDVKGIYDKKQYSKDNFIYWRL